jgi:magnesium-transporting ATPase (P-type)
MMTTVYMENPKVVYPFTKGAPDFLIEKCTKFINKDGKIVNITDSFIKDLQKTISMFAS